MSEKYKADLSAKRVEFQGMSSVKMNHHSFSLVKNEPNEHENEPK
jgi:hypothetical protein